MSSSSSIWYAGNRYLHSLQTAKANWSDRPKLDSAWRWFQSKSSLQRTANYISLFERHFCNNNINSSLIHWPAEAKSWFDLWWRGFRLSAEGDAGRTPPIMVCCCCCCCDASASYRGNHSREPSQGTLPASKVVLPGGEIVVGYLEKF